MTAVVPTRMISAPDYAELLDTDGRIVTVGPWLALTNPANPDSTPCYRMVDGAPRPISPDAVVAMVVPGMSDAVMNLINAGFVVKSAQTIETAGPWRQK